jgi:hypothetical protein
MIEYEIANSSFQDTVLSENTLERYFASHMCRFVCDVFNSLYTKNKDAAKIDLVSELGLVGVLDIYK